MIYLDDEHHEKLWRICDALVSAGARAAMICDALSGSVLVSVGDADAPGSVSRVERLGAHEKLIHGDGGQVYGVDIVGGGLLAVLHDADALEKIRGAATKAADQAGEILTHLPPAPARPAWPPAPHDDHGHPVRKRTAKAKKKAAKPKAVPKKKKPASKKRRRPK